MSESAANPFDLTGHCALVTGGNSGIGLGMARGLAAAGADICIWGTNHEKNTRAVEELKRHGTRVGAIICDVGDEDAVDAAFAETVSAIGKIDSCFVNAGVGGAASSFREMTAQEWKRVLRVNLDGAFYTLRAAVDHMTERGQGGSLVATASLAALEGQPRGQHYAASKGALVSVMRSIAVECARHGIRANTILPGWIESPMTDALFQWEKFQQKVLPRIPVRRWGTADDFAAIAVYLAGPASAYHTGDTIVIDGGYSKF